MIPLTEQITTVIAEIARLKEVQKQGNLREARAHPDLTVKRQQAHMEAVLQTMLRIETDQAIIAQVKICAQRNRANCQHCESIAKVLEEIEDDAV